MSTIVIEEALPEQIDFLSHMWQKIDLVSSSRPFGGDTDQKQSYAAEFIEHAIKSKNAVLLVAYEQDAQNKEFIGTISGHLHERPTVKLSSIGVIFSLWVDKEKRKQGIGQLLLDTIEQRLITLGAQSFQVAWDSDNKQASEWWQKRGYKSYEIIASKNIDINQS
jgi:ribosomal protein S18 acetylase RimI-like enzyme